MTGRLALAALVAATATARAEPEAHSMNEEAQAHLDRGEALYEAGEYARAIAEFDRGLRVDAHPDFYYAKAQAYRRLGDCVHAVAQYQAYLASHPPDDKAEAARKNIERCPVPPAAESPAALDATPPAPPARPPPEPERPRPPSEPWYRDRVTLALAVTSAGLLATGTTLLALGERDIRAANGAGTLSELETRGARGEHLRLAGAVVAIGGGVAAIAAVVHHALADHHERSTALRDRRGRRSLALGAGSSGLIVLWGGPW